MAEGWISIHRQLLDNWLWEEKPFSRGQAWIDLLLQANYVDKKFVLGGELIEVKRGSFITSMRKLCVRWGWSNTKVKQFLSILESEEMIVKKNDKKKTVLTILKYSVFQDLNDKKTTQKRHKNDTETTLKHTTNKDNKDNKENKYICVSSVEEKNESIKHGYGEYQNVLLSDDDIEKLKKEFPNDYKQWIEILGEYMASTGKIYKNHLATIRRWARKDKKEELLHPASDFDYKSLYEN